MNEPLTTAHVELMSEERAADSRTIFGFWVYLMTDCVLFASLFATYAVLHGNTFGGPGSAVFSLPFVLLETFVLLTSSFTSGLSVVAARDGKTRQVLAWLGVTFILGALFVGLEVSEFIRLALSGESWSGSAFLSSYFTLVGTHGLHVAAGLVWMVMLGARVAQRGITRANVRKLFMLGMFWHFLDIIWIFIFTIVYLVDAL